jgi:diguanylate cyclase (GGDEF)-like protein
MDSGLIAPIAAVAGLAVGWLIGRRTRRAGGDAVGPHLLPEPALRWLLRAHGALGVWVSELRQGEDGPSNERVVDAERLSVVQITAVDRRLERARDQEQAAAERMDGGTLVFRGAAGIAVAMLLPEGHGAAALGQAEEDLARLIAGVQRRPQMVALTQAQADESSEETAGSIGLRLAYHLERITGAEVVVAAIEPGTDTGAGTPAAVRVVGASGRADRRLLDSYAAPDSVMARVARGEGERVLADADFMGGAVADRRQRRQPVLVLPLLDRRLPVGAVALWLPDGREPVGAAFAEIAEAIANAAPRVRRAMRSHFHAEVARTDPLTGLSNRRVLEAALARQDATEGALIYADLDHFKGLNDALGHPAGDAALVHFARLIREQIRTGDVGARIGGEEFAVWLPGATLEAGMRIAERLRVKLNTTPWDWQGRPRSLSASFGVSACPGTSRRLENLPAQADAALYVAKNSGRNRVEPAGRAVAG